MADIAMFLMKFRGELLRLGVWNPDAVCASVLSDEEQPPLTTLKAYQQAWLVCHAAESVLTNEFDGTRVERWLTALAHATFDFEDAFQTEHGYMPLNACEGEWYGPVGRA
jgi:hypothetical protein